MSYAARMHAAADAESGQCGGAYGVVIDARSHIIAARRMHGVDPERSYVFLYDAACIVVGSNYGAQYGDLITYVRKSRTSIHWGV